MGNATVMLKEVPAVSEKKDDDIRIRRVGRQDAE
jgi:hypothetical protein